MAFIPFLLLVLYPLHTSFVLFSFVPFTFLKFHAFFPVFTFISLTTLHTNISNNQNYIRQPVLNSHFSSNYIFVYLSFLPQTRSSSFAETPRNLNIRLYFMLFQHFPQFLYFSYSSSRSITKTSKFIYLHTP